MSKPSDAQIENILRRVVKNAVKKGEEVKVNEARARAESELGLDDGFFKNDAEWKGRSKNVIVSTFQEDGAEEATPEVSAKEQSKVTATETAKPLKQPAEQKSVPQQRSNKIAATSSEPTTTSDKTTQPTPSKLSKTSPIKSPTKVDESSDESSADSATDEEGEDEDGDEDTASQTGAQERISPKKPESTVPNVNGVKRKASDSSGSDDAKSGSDSGEDSGTEDEPRAKKAKVDSASEVDQEASEEDGDDESKGSKDGHDEDEGSGSGSGSESGSGSGSGSGSDSGSESGGSKDQNDKEDETESPRQDSQPQPEDAEPPRPPLEAIPAKPFKPPSGYTALSADQLQSNTAFSTASLNGKQIWHITAPSNLPLSSLTEISLDSMKSGATLMTHNNIDYTLNEESQGSNDHVALMIPSADGYKRLEHKVERTLQIQQKIILPNLSVRQANPQTGSTAAADVAQPATTNVRPQPKGLRMRYKPPGFGKGKPGMIGSGSDSAEEDEDDHPPPPAKATFQFPKALGAHGASTRETAGGAETNADVEMSSPKKPKKKRKEKEKEGSQALANGVSASPEASAVVAAAKKPEDTHGKAVPNSAEPATESKEDKAKRKEEKRSKRERKEAKRKSQEA